MSDISIFSPIKYVYFDDKMRRKRRQVDQLYNECYELLTCAVTVEIEGFNEVQFIRNRINSDVDDALFTIFEVLGETPFISPTSNATSYNSEVTYTPNAGTPVSTGKTIMQLLKPLFDALLDRLAFAANLELYRPKSYHIEFVHLFKVVNKLLNDIYNHDKSEGSMPEVGTQTHKDIIDELREKYNYCV